MAFQRRQQIQNSYKKHANSWEDQCHSFQLPEQRNKRFTVSSVLATVFQVKLDSPVLHGSELLPSSITGFSRARCTSCQPIINQSIIFNFKTNPRKKNKYNTGKPENPGIIKAGCLL